MKKTLVLTWLLMLSVYSFGQNKVVSQKEVYDMIVKAGIVHPVIVLKQGIHESANFKSKAARLRNNIFGFQSGKTVFKSIRSAVYAYKRWQVKRYKNPKEDYYRFLTRVGYAADKLYNKKVRNIKINFVPRMTREEFEVLMSKLRAAEEEYSKEFAIAMEKPSIQECESHILPYTCKVEELDQERRINIPKEQIVMRPDTLNGDLMTLKDFKLHVSLGGFTDYDGVGYYSTETEVSNIDIFPSDTKTRTDFTHVMWYNR